MSEFEEKLNAILSNPDAMSQVMNLAQSLNLGGGGESPPAQPADSPGPRRRAVHPLAEGRIWGIWQGWGICWDKSIRQ